MSTLYLLISCLIEGYLFTAGFGICSHLPGFITFQLKLTIVFLSGLKGFVDY